MNICLKFVVLLICFLLLVWISLSKDHIDAIRYGLPSEYNTFFLTINSQTEDYSIKEIESLLLA